MRHEPSIPGVPGVTGEKRPRRAWAAALLALLTPGLGHLYAGHPKAAAAAFFAAYPLALMLFSLVLFSPSAFSIAALFALGIGIGLAIIVHAAVVANRAGREYTLRPYNRWWLYLGIIICFAFIVQPATKALINAFLIEAYRIPGSAMEPGILVGDYILADRRPGARRPPPRNAVVIFRSVNQPDIAIIKRVVGLPGDTLATVEGQLYRNGAAVAEPWARPPGAEDTAAFESRPGSPRTWGPIVVPPDSHFVLGDNRPNSYDSRYHGPVGVASLLGRPAALYFSLRIDEGYGVRWERIGKTPWVVQPN